MRIKVIGYWLLVIGCLTLTSCKNDIVYSQFSSISYPDGTITSSGNWHMDSVAHFEYQIADTALGYQMNIYVRHTDRYPYQNMWLFVGDSAKQDTIQFYLADERGRWLGNKHNAFMEVPVIFGRHIHFADTGTYQLVIRHGMRDTLLQGVTDIGVEIVKDGKE